MKRWAKADKEQPPVNWRLTILLWVLTEYLMFRFVAGCDTLGLNLGQVF